MAALVLPKGKTIQDIEAHLKADLTDYQVHQFGVVGKGLKVSGGFLAGATVVVLPVGRLIAVKARPSSLIANWMDTMSLGLLGLIGGSGRVCHRTRESIERMLGDTAVA